VPPTLPANVIVGQPAWRQNMWSSGSWAFQNTSTIQTWKDRGQNGWKIGTYHLRRFGNTTGGGGTVWLPHQVAQSTNSHQYALQPGDGSGVGGGGGNNNAAEAAALGWETYIGFDFEYGSGQGTSAPPWTTSAAASSPTGGWFDDAKWATIVLSVTELAETVEWLGLTGIVFDTELPGGDGWKTNHAGNANHSLHSASSVRAKARQRGYEMATAIFTAKPDCEISWYGSAGLPGGINNKVQQVVNGKQYPFAIPHEQVLVDFLQGLFDAMIEQNATGTITMVDHTWYRSMSQTFGGGSPGTENEAACAKLNSQGSRSWISDYFDEDVWDYACRHLAIVHFTWRGTDGTSFYDATQPTNSAWATMLLNARLYSEGHRRWEYTHHQGTPSDHWSGSVPHYSEAANISAQQAADNTAQVAGAALPTVTGFDGTGDPRAFIAFNVAVLQMRAEHLYGIKAVRVYDAVGFDDEDPEPNYLGAGFLDWQENGGSITTDFDDSYMQVQWQSGVGEFSPGAEFVYCVETIKGDERWGSVLIPGGGGNATVQPEILARGVTIISPGVGAQARPPAVLAGALSLPVPGAAVEVRPVKLVGAVTVSSPASDRGRIASTVTFG
jgi:hypothetical protein